MFTQADRYVMAFALFVLLGLVSYERNQDWQTPRQLWESARLNAPMNPRPLLSLAHLEAEARRMDLAEADYLEVLNLIQMDRSPLYQSHFRNAALTNLGLIKAMNGDSRTGLGYINLILAEFPNSEFAHFNRGLIYLNSGRQEEAQRDFALSKFD